MKAQGEAGGTGPHRLGVCGAVALFLVSASVIAFQVILMRSFSITRYHHFSYMVISVALLGFGISGTCLTFSVRTLKGRFRWYSSLLIGLYAIAVPASYYLSEILPIDIQYVLFSGRQLLMVLACDILLMVPFFLAGMVIGLALAVLPDDVPLIYGINLLGSGAGGVAAVAALLYFPPFILPSVLAVVVLLAFFLWTVSGLRGVAGRAKDSPGAVVQACVIAGVLLFQAIPAPVHVDQYKAAAQLENLRRQSGARKLLTRFSPRAKIDVYESSHLHQALFAGLNADTVPPPQLAILVDGSLAGSIFTISSAEEARILDFTPQSLGYRLKRRPRVLILGEIGGTNVWLAKRFGAETITVVQGNGQLNEILARDLRERSGNVYGMPGVRVVTQEPHIFIESAEERFDIIHIASAEGMSAGISGLQSLHENYLLTVESMAKCVRLLSEEGLITVTRGLQMPPRDNLRIFALFVTALERLGVKDPGAHLLQSRNYLAVNTMLSMRAIDRALVGRFREESAELLMDPEYFPGISSEKMLPINELEGPPGETYSYLRYGIVGILSRERQDFYRSWVYRICPPTDDAPYFFDFFKWGSIRRFINVYGSSWFQRLEVGYAVLVVTFVGICVVAFFGVLSPLFLIGSKGRAAPGKLKISAYFLALGFAFMFIEMVATQKFTRYLGDPVYAAAIAITSILLFAGMGSLTQARDVPDPARRMKWAGITVALLALVYPFFLDQLLGLFLTRGLFQRSMVTALSLAPMAFFMGWMFPNGLLALERRAAWMVPWAWGLNGFASVAAAPLAVIFSMSLGFSNVMRLAALLYLIAALTGGMMSRGKEEG